MPNAGLDLAIVALWYSKISLDSWTLTWSTPALYSNSIGLILVPSCNYGKDMRWGNSSELNVDLRCIILRSNNGLALDDTGSDWLRWLCYAVLLATAVFLRVILLVQCLHFALHMLFDSSKLLIGYVDSWMPLYNRWISLCYWTKDCRC